MARHHETRALIANLLKLFGILGGLTCLGTFGFMYIEGWGVVDSLYMSVITLSTVGFQEVHPLSENGRLFLIGYLIVGLGGFLYAVVQIGEFIVRVELSGLFGGRRMDKILNGLKEHYIICGAGRVGIRICEFLEERKLPFVAIDTDKEVRDVFQAKGWNFLLGDATDDLILIGAGIERARGLCTVLSTDSDNVFVVLSARLLNKDVQIISRGSTEKADIKLKRAGANHVVSLFATGASKIANLLSNQKMENFMEIFNDKSGELDLVELKMRNNDKYVGQTLAKTNFTSQGIMIVAIRHSGGTLQIPPNPQYEISLGDSLIAVGKAENISVLTNIN